MWPFRKKAKKPAAGQRLLLASGSPNFLKDDIGSRRFVPLSNAAPSPSASRSVRQDDWSTDLANPLNPFSPLNPMKQVTAVPETVAPTPETYSGGGGDFGGGGSSGSWSDSSSSSASDYSSSSYDSGSSSSFDSGSSGGGDW